MPPHCDTLDGPVVKAARLALERGSVNLILPYVPRAADAELRRAFERASRVRALSPEAQETVDYWFFETAVRLHREGEGAPFTGLKPAGLDSGPAVPRAEKAVETGRLEEVGRFLHGVLDEQLHHRFHQVLDRRGYDENDVDAARAYVQAMLGFIVYTHTVYTKLLSSPHEHPTEEVAHAEHAGHHH
jgi:Family of unknown function (DUF6448)